MSVAGLRRRLGTTTIAALSVGSFATLAGCGGSGGETITPPPTGTPAIAIALSASTLDVQQGANGSVTVTVTRSGGFTGSVNLAVEGLPASVTAPAATIAAGQTSGTIAVTAAAAASAGTSQLTVRATGTGVSAVTASLALTVRAQPVTSGSFTLTANPTTVSVVQGASATVTLTIARTGSFTGPVALSVTGASTGLTPTLSAASVTGNSATLTVAAGGTLAVGTQTLSIKGTGAGAAEQTVSLPVTITAKQEPSTGNVAWKFCGTSGLPLWLAAQDGTGTWTRVTGANDTYSFTINQSRGGVAYVVPMGAGFDLEVFYGTTAELQARGTEVCNGAVGAGKSVNATIAGASGTDMVLATLGRSIGSANLTQSTTIPFTGVQSGNVDLIASRSTLTLVGFTPTFNLSKMIIRRGLNPAAGSTLPVIDFGAAEAFEPVTRNLTVGNIGSDISVILGAYTTANNSFGAFQTDITGGTGTRTYRGVPAAKQAAGDFHILSISAVPSLLEATQTRNVISVFKDATDKTVALGPTLTTPTLSTLSGGGYGRTRAAITVQPEYNRYFVMDVQQQGATPRRTEVQQTAGYASGSPLTLDVPDLSGVSGFNVSWGLRTGTPATWTISASGWTGSGGIVTPAFVEGATYVAGTRQGSITP